ncbi:hypothetical protein EDC01DRAFT_727496 [Geopyxis carbonaria]|nr:hypothetical protein EDC01DRAFT_727496 [Geopyxis carbonaria]
MSYDPTGGLREISTLSSTPRPLDPDSTAYTTYGDAPPPPRTLFQRTLQLRATRPPGAPRRPSRFRLNPLKTSPRLRLIFRIISLIASGTTFASLSDVLFTYAKTRELRDVWPAKTDVVPTVAVLVASLACFIGDLVWFGCSARERVRLLPTTRLRAWAAGMATVMVAGQIAAIVYADIDTARGGRDGMDWVCTAKSQEWDEKVSQKVDFAFLCGEVAAAGVARWGVVGAQVAVLMTVVWEVVAPMVGSRKGERGMKTQHQRGVGWWEEVASAPERAWRWAKGVVGMGKGKGVYEEVKGGV